MVITKIKYSFKKQFPLQFLKPLRLTALSEDFTSHPPFPEIDYKKCA